MKLIYVMDPYCGWCYAMNEQIHTLAAHFSDQLPIQVLPAGMWTGNNRQLQSPAFISRIKSYDIQIAARSGVSFSSAYYQNLQDTTQTLDSEIPSRAIITADNHWPHQTLACMHEIHRARYVMGKDLNKTATYTEIATTLAIPPDIFTERFTSADIIEKTSQAFILADKYAHNYPTLLLLHDKKTTIIEQGYAPASHLIKTIACKLHTAYNIHLN